MPGWYGVDLDGTLAVHTGPVWNDDGTVHIGPPVPAMVERVQAHILRGDRVRVMTARVFIDPDTTHATRRREVIAQDAAIGEWCYQHVGARLQSTCMKDYAMIALYDDRAIQIEHNTGRRMDGDTAADVALLESAPATTTA